MDEPQPSIELPELMRDLAWLKHKAMHLCRNPSHSAQFELVAIEGAVQIIVKIINAVHLRDIEVGQRQLESFMTRQDWRRD